MRCEPTTENVDDETNTSRGDRNFVVGNRKPCSREGGYRRASRSTEKFPQREPRHRVPKVFRAIYRYVWLAPIGHCQPRAADIPKSVGNSTVWLAPVGHCQPRAADIPKSAPEPEDSAILERENAFVDSKIGICRGC